MARLCGGYPSYTKYAPSCPSGLSTILGARSRYLVSRRSTQRSGGSLTWESEEINCNSAMLRLLSGVYKWYPVASLGWERWAIIRRHANERRGSGGTLTKGRWDTMITEVELPVEERLLQLLQHLGIARAHVAARGGGDWGGLAASHPDCIASLTLICPRGMDPSVLGPLAPRLLVLAGDQGRPDALVRQAVAHLQTATLITLRDYVSPTIYADVVADRSADIGAAMVDFLARMDQVHGTRTVALPQGEGEVAGISYHIRGSGPPLVLLPLGVAPSQWEPLVSRLSERWCTITLGGAYLGMIGSLEARGRTAGYLGVVRRLIEEAELRPGESVLEVGCGTGVLDRWLARHTGGANRIVGLDISRYLLREAMALVRQEGLEDVIEFREGRAEALPFPEGSFDVAMSSTVIQRLDADRM